MAKGKEPSTSFLKMLNTLRIKSLEVTRAESHPSYVPSQRRMVSEAAGRIAKTNKFHSVKTVPADTQRRPRYESCHGKICMKIYTNSGHLDKYTQMRSLSE